MKTTTKQPLSIVGLFAGIGGIEIGLGRHGHSSIMLVENDPKAQSVLRNKFPDVELTGDVRALNSIPECDLISAGFPCQDLSQCGQTKGIDGDKSSVIEHVFHILREGPRPQWILMENVPFMLSLQGGKAIRLITSQLESLGYNWAYRTVNAQAFGVPQRRNRVVILASNEHDPGDVLFADNQVEPQQVQKATAYGFYWTEGSTGIGWAVDSVPTLKGGSTIGIPSPPAVWIPDFHELRVIDIRDAERLQGLPTNWTATSETLSGRGGCRWRLVGNAVCTKVSEWVGGRLRNPKESVCDVGIRITEKSKWPKAAQGGKTGAYAVDATAWPVVRKTNHLLEFLKYPLTPLSARATRGFLSRAKNSRLKFADDFLKDVEIHLRCMEDGKNHEPFIYSLVSA